MPTLTGVMRQEVLCVPPDLPLSQLADLFRGCRTGGAAVVADGKVLGLVSAVDVLTLAAALDGYSPTRRAATDPYAQPENRPADGSERRAPVERGPRRPGCAQPAPLEYRWGAPAADGRSALHEYRNEIAAEGRGAPYEYTVADVMSRDEGELQRMLSATAIVDASSAKSAEAEIETIRHRQPVIGEEQI